MADAANAKRILNNFDHIILKSCDIKTTAFLIHT